MGAFFWNYLLYGAVGNLLEIVFFYFRMGRLVDRKCHLLLPVSPVYGAGAALVLLLPQSIRRRPLLLAVTGGAICTGVEWAFSLFYQLAAHTQFWDYTGQVGQLGGRVCPLFSLIWGVLCLPLVYFAAPLTQPVVSQLPASLTWPVFLFYVLDGLCSLLLLRQYGADALHWSFSV